MVKMDQRDFGVAQASLNDADTLGMGLLTTRLLKREPGIELTDFRGDSSLIRGRDDPSMSFFTTS